MKSSVTFPSAGLELAGHLYVPDGEAVTRRPAVVVGHPGGGVMEQIAGLYAQRLAEQDTAEQAANLGGRHAVDGFEYSCTPRAQHERSAKAFAWSSVDRMAFFDALRSVHPISPRPMTLAVSRGDRPGNPSAHG